MPRKNHWWHITLYVTAQGLHTGAIPYQGFTFDIHFNFIQHQLEITTSRGGSRKFKLKNGLSVAEFYSKVFEFLRELSVEVKILAKPYDVPFSSVPFVNDHTHHHYNTEQVNRYWQVLSQVDQVLKEFSGRFYGKTCPAQLYWHHFDLVITRFSGKKIPVKPDASTIEKDAYSHEVISFGFWPGDENIPEPAFYSYTYPSPENIDKQPLHPKPAEWIDSNGSPMALLKYEDLRKEADPKKALLEFLESAYQAGAKLAEWPINEWKVPDLNEL